MATQLYNLEYEKQFLSAVIRNPAILADCSFINDKDFSDTNRVVFQGVQACLSSVGPGGFSRFVLIERLKTLNLKIAGTVDPEVYIEALERIGINDKAAIEVGRQLKKWTIRRRLNETARQMLALTEDKEATERPAMGLLAEMTQQFNAEVNVLEGADEKQPNDLYGGIGDFLSHQTIYDTRSLTAPFPVFSDMYGALDAQNLTVIASRMKVGKSTFWLSMLQQLAANDPEDRFRALVLDTELTTVENQSRALSAASGIGEYFIRHKLYKKTREMREKVELAEQQLAPLKGRVFHQFIGGLELDQRLSIARRWAHRTLKDGKIGLIVLDYYKLSSNLDFRSRNPLFLTIGEQVNAFKQLSTELNLHILCFAQTNRENEDSKAGYKQTNSSVIGGSDMIAQFASNIFLLERLSPEERAMYSVSPERSFTHTLKEIATRQLGPNDLRQHRLVKYQDERGKDRYCQNHLLFNFDHFHVKEMGTFYDLVERNRARIDVQAATPPLVDVKML